MEFVDSHAHLTDRAFDADRDDAITRARETGARAIVCIATSPADGDVAAALARKHRLLAYTAGLHPHDASSFDRERDIPRIRGQIAGGAVAIGECGLDYHYDNSQRDAQRRAFTEQLALAAELHCPVVVHTRDAVDDTAAMVREAARSGVVGVLHCFTGPGELAELAIEIDWYISFSGIVTFPRFTDESLLRIVPEERLLVESDSPYLAPVPHRGKRNEPAWVTFTIARLAAARDTTADALAHATAENAWRLFRIEHRA